MNKSPKGTNTALIEIIVVVLLGIAATSVLIASNNVERNDSINPKDITKEVPTTNTVVDEKSIINEASNLVDGSYNARGSYLTPGGSESIDVMITLVNGKVTEASLTQNAITGESKEFQSRFASGYKAEVVGKNVDEINLSRVAGSSLTPVGFNSAIEDIKDEARA